jgi:hypothetical protein
MNMTGFFHSLENNRAARTSLIVASIAVASAAILSAAGMYLGLSIKQWEEDTGSKVVIGSLVLSALAINAAMACPYRGQPLHYPPIIRFILFLSFTLAGAVALFGLLEMLDWLTHR